ncbi:unnamed protein product [Didymodactylos carnosus]|uniref:Uncharacterized protein n=1 Tax=Didymodactylos carnosus TaxID=1234261 RepID=A0A8S2DVY4_9BILA|nr:unnamed protein product [Didymodactylos carnosus]CAF3785463.1 unnamed protein product [Didymodactylos carnosus]
MMNLKDLSGKGLGKVDKNAACVADLNWNLLKENISLPSAVLYEECIDHNLRWMQRFIREYNFQLAPHGKTTMAPKLFSRQLKQGAWGNKPYVYHA